MNFTLINERYGLLLYTLLVISFIGLSCTSETHIDNHIGQESVVTNTQQISVRKRQLPIIKPKMIEVKGGSFMMGALPEEQFGDKEKPSHKVTLDSYAIGMTEITNKQYVNFLNNSERFEDRWIVLKSDWCKIKKEENLYQVGHEFEEHPVVEVTWYGAVAYCNWLSEEEGLSSVYTFQGKEVESDLSIKAYRLPTEAEWEYAARSRGKNEKYAGTNDRRELADYANFYGNQNDYKVTAPVASFKSNDLGLFDMSGNVSEWCEDWYSESFYAESEERNPCKLDWDRQQGLARVFRGGDWAGIYRKVSQRSGIPPADDNPNDNSGHKYLNLGFRVVLPS